MADDTSKRPGQVPPAEIQDQTRSVRRRFLVTGAAITAAAALSSLPAPAVARHGGYPRIDLPFTLGVASGDPLPHQVVIWTRLAPAPQEPGGGMPDRPVLVYWEVARDEGFRRIARKGVTFARPQYGHHNYRRGYVRCEVTPGAWITDFRTVPFVQEPGAAISTRATFVLEDGDPVPVVVGV